MTLRFIILASILLCSGCDPKFVKMELWMWSENHKSMDFYGKVVDQDGIPVEGVTVTAGVGTIESFTRSGGRKYDTVSDARGRFSFTGIHGAGCGYLLKKEGYEFSQRLPCSSRPKNYVPDPNKPVIFPVWKLHGREHLLESQIQAGLACDGTPRKFDPLTGSRDAGMLTASLIRKPVNIDPGKPFDWSMTLQLPSGGLAPVSDPYPNLAPAEGYQSSVKIEMSSDAKDWNPHSVKSFYFFDGEHYGRITIDIMANYQPPPTHIEIHSFVNPSGSRNLEGGHTAFEY